MGVSNEDREDFRLYLENCTNAQVQGVYEKEREARRNVYVDLAKAEARRRGIELH